MKTLKLPSGMTYSYDLFGKKICTGSMMGRRGLLPENTFAPLKLQMIKLRMSACGCYDQGGAYFGAGLPIYWARSELSELGKQATVFVRAITRGVAKEKIRAILPNARFYN